MKKQTVFQTFVAILLMLSSVAHAQEETPGRKLKAYLAQAETLKSGPDVIRFLQGLKPYGETVYIGAVEFWDISKNASMTMDTFEMMTERGMLDSPQAAKEFIGLTESWSISEGGGTENLRLDWKPFHQDVFGRLAAKGMSFEAILEIISTTKIDGRWAYRLEPGLAQSILQGLLASGQIKTKQQFFDIVHKMEETFERNVGHDTDRLLSKSFHYVKPFVSQMSLEELKEISYMLRWTSLDQLALLDLVLEGEKRNPKLSAAQLVELFEFSSRMNVKHDFKEVGGSKAQYKMMLLAKAGNKDAVAQMEAQYKERLVKQFHLSLDNMDRVEDKVTYEMYKESVADLLLQNKSVFTNAGLSLSEWLKIRDAFKIPYTTFSGIMLLSTSSKAEIRWRSLTTPPPSLFKASHNPVRILSCSKTYSL